MSSQAGSAVPPPISNGSAGPSTQTHQGAPSPGESDPELAVIFGEMRHAIRLTREQLAERLVTDVTTVAALEQGAVDHLPDVAETNRIVATYTNLLGLDARPILRRIDVRRQLASEQGAAAAHPPIPDEEPAPALPSERRDHGTATAEHGYETPDLAAEYFETGPRRRFGVRRAVGWLMLMTVLGGLVYGVWYLVQRPQLVWSTVQQLPDPIPRLTRTAWELFKPLEGRTTPGGSEGDPRSRKADRLPMASPPAGN